MSESEEVMEISKKKARSPHYPYVSLGKAIERARQLKQAEAFHSVPMASAAKAWGFNAKSSAGLQTIAALKAFGLIDDEGSGDRRHLKVSALGRRILLDERQDSPDLSRAIQEACLKPSIHRELWEKYGASPPSTETMTYYLTVGRTEQGKAPYEEDAARKVVKVYRESISFAALSESDKVSTDDEERVEKSAGDPRGDAVGGDTRKKTLPKDPPRNLSGGEASGMKQDVFSLNEGDVVLTWPAKLSRESLEDLKAWLEVVQRKIDRTVATTHALTAAAERELDDEEEDGKQKS